MRADFLSNCSIDKQSVRIQTLRKEFQRVYGGPADFVVRAPGRVNIIGEELLNFCHGSSMGRQKVVIEH